MQTRVSYNNTGNGLIPNYIKVLLITTRALAVKFNGRGMKSLNNVSI